jgi:hypothetical protein
VSWARASEAAILRRLNEIQGRKIPLKAGSTPAERSDRLKKTKEPEMSENGHLGKDFIRVAKRIVARAKKAGGRPLLERIFCAKGTATASCDKVLIQIDTGSDAVGYVDPKPLAAKDAEFFVKSDGLNVRQDETLTHHVKPADGDYTDIQKHFPQLTNPGGTGYHDAILVDPVALIDALDIFEKKGDGPSRPPRVTLYLPTADNDKAPVIVIGTTPDDKDGRAMVMPLKVQK